MNSKKKPAKASKNKATASKAERTDSDFSLPNSQFSPAQTRLVPKLRFPEFREGNAWEQIQLSTIAAPVTARAAVSDNDPVLSLSAEHGIILQTDYFGKKIAGDNSARYLKITRNDFVYNDRITKASSFGTIKRLSKHAGGIVSPIYKCFRFRRGEIPVFWEWYFESSTHDCALAALVNEGARAGRFNISISQFLSTIAWMPTLAEQQKIASCLSSLDELIAAQARKLEALRTHKKALMQQLFPRDGETTPRLRFPEFQDAGEWEGKTISDFGHVVTGSTPSTAQPKFMAEESHSFLRRTSLTSGLSSRQKLH